MIKATQTAIMMRVEYRNSRKEDIDKTRTTPSQKATLDQELLKIKNNASAHSLVNVPILRLLQILGLSHCDN